MSHNMDLRVLKTHKLIKDSFIQLMDEKGFKNITVNDIAERAIINRSTFYLHFTDKYDLLDQIVDLSIKELMELVTPEAHISEGKLEYNSFIQNIQIILGAIAKDALLYKSILNDNEMLDIRKKMENVLKEKLNQSFSAQTLISKDLFLELITSLYIGAITWWLNNDMKYSKTYMAEQLVKLLTAGPAKMAGIDLS